MKIELAAINDMEGFGVPGLEVNSSFDDGFVVFSFGESHKGCVDSNSGFDRLEEDAKGFEPSTFNMRERMWDVASPRNEQFFLP